MIDIRRVRPVGNKVLVTYEAEKERVSAGGIVLLATEQNKKNRVCEGVVISIGPGKRLANGEYVPIDLEPGDRIQYDKFGATGTHVDGVPYAVVDIDYVDGVIVQ